MVDAVIVFPVGRISKNSIIEDECYARSYICSPYK